MDGALERVRYRKAATAFIVAVLALPPLLGGLYLAERRFWIGRQERRAFEDWLADFDRCSSWRGRSFSHAKLTALFDQARAELAQPGQTCQLRFDDQYAVVFFRTGEWSNEWGRGEYDIVVAVDVVRVSLPQRSSDGGLMRAEGVAIIEYHLGQHELDIWHLRGRNRGLVRDRYGRGISFGLCCNGIRKTQNGGVAGDFGPHHVAGRGLIIIIDASGSLVSIQSVFSPC